MRYHLFDPHISCSPKTVPFVSGEGVPLEDNEVDDDSLGCQCEVSCDVSAHEMVQCACQVHSVFEDKEFAYDAEVGQVLLLKRFG